MTPTIVLVRHGETDWNRERRFQGHADSSLNAVGRAGARRLAADLLAEPVVALYSSPLARALETARIVGDRLRIEVETDDRLREIDVGSWQGLTRTEVESRFPAGYRRWLRGQPGWKGGETYDDLAKRVLPALVSIAQGCVEGLVVAVTHGGPIRVAVRAARGSSAVDAMSIENCAAVRIAVRDGLLEGVD